MLNKFLRHFKVAPVRLECGINEICHYQEGDTASIGLFINSGSRSEDWENNGVSHFLEHMYFKGTENQTAEDIMDDLEFTGSLLNAHTSREYTCYTLHFVKEELELAMKTLSDMILHPQITEKDVQSERDTILREYEDVNSVMEEYFFDILHEQCFPHHSLGYTILGPLPNIKKNIGLHGCDFFYDLFIL